jgi:DNA-binding CsgD family transcriptional regulator
MMKGEDMTKLTAREQECLYWASQGKTSWEMGRILGITERTANFHITNLCDKLGVRSRQAAIAQALHRNLLNLDRTG